MQITLGQDFLTTINAYRASYRRYLSLHEALNKAMKLWVSFTMAHTTQADPEAIRTNLLGPATNPQYSRGKRSAAFGPQNNRANQRALATIKPKRAPRVRALKGRSAARQETLKNTLAGAIAYAWNYRGIRNLPLAAAYAVIERLISARTNSVGYHKFGYVPALRRLKGSANNANLSQFQGRGRFTRNSPPGLVAPAEPDTATPIVEVTNFARAIVEMNGNAPEATIPEVLALLQKFTTENLNATQQRLSR